MDAAREIARSLPPVDLVAAGLLLLGLLWGLLRGLIPLFAALLWTLLALWLGSTLAPLILEQMPNTELADEALARLNAFGVLAGLLLLLPVLARLLGSRGGEATQERRPATQRAFGAVAGLATAALLATLAMPFALRLPTLSDNAEQAHAPALAEDLAESLGVLFPPEVGASLRGELGAAAADAER